MMQERTIVTALHTGTKRDYLQRMLDAKVHCMEVAKQYGRDYWDGDRRYGYGGYRYDGRWQRVAQQLIDIYGLTTDSAILDVGCGKAYVLYEIHVLLPGIRIAGFDISTHALEGAKPAIRAHLFRHRAEDPYPFDDHSFDLVISLTTLHNLPLPQLVAALRQMERVARDKYLVVESYRNDTELFNLQCWALTCETFLRPEEWLWVFEQAGYTGDYEFIYFG